MVRRPWAQVGDDDDDDDKEEDYGVHRTVFTLGGASNGLKC